MPDSSVNKNAKPKSATRTDPASADTHAGQAASRPPEARLVRGFRDVEAAELRRLEAMLATIRRVYERYGFDPLETPAFEYTDALGKFLPDQDRPNAGVFSVADDDGQWTSLRYDLTAPLARYVAQNFDRLPKPFRRYAVGTVYRNEKPGPGRFRQFTQFDADTVGAESIAADAEMCMLAADTLEALGLRDRFVIKVNSRKVLDGLRESVGLSGAEHYDRWLTVMRAIDKYDRLGLEGVTALLTSGRTDASGDHTPGAGLEQKLALRIMNALLATTEVWTPLGPEADPVDELIDVKNGARCYWNNFRLIDLLKMYIGGTESGDAAIAELTEMFKLLRAAGYGSRRVRFASETVRGLEYYTGPVFEAELTMEVRGEDGQPVRFGSVGGGGRYDDLVARFTGEKVPATGFSIGVSRLSAALSLLAKNRGEAELPALGPVVVLVMDRDQLTAYQRLTRTLRDAGIRAEMYLGSAGMKAQMKYADKRGAAVVVIQGSNERERGEVQLKDLIEGGKAAAAIKDNAEWKAARPAQVTVPEADMVTEVRRILAKYGV